MWILVGYNDEMVAFILNRHWMARFSYYLTIYWFENEYRAVDARIYTHPILAISLRYIIGY